MALFMAAASAQQFSSRAHDAPLGFAVFLNNSIQFFASALVCFFLFCVLASLERRRMLRTPDSLQRRILLLFFAAAVQFHLVLSFTASSHLFVPSLHLFVTPCC